MGRKNAFSITYGSRLVGGSSNSYLLHGPYVLDKSFSTLRVVFDVIVVAGSYSGLQSASDTLETDFSKRDQSIVISLAGSTWTYTFGSSLLNSTASIQKSGNSDTDRGYSRGYTCVVEGELPAGDNDGLRDIEMNVDYESGRQRIVTMRGTYTPHGGSDAVAQYLSDFDNEATTLLDGVDNSATWELVDENYTQDRTKHLCNFVRQYVELLADQSQAGTDDSEIRDHRMHFSDISQHPGDSQESTYRLRRVTGSYECSIDIEETTDLYGVFEDKVKPHVTQLFQDNFVPSVFCVEDRRVSYDETAKRMSVSITFLYQPSAGGDVLEVSQSLTYREQRTIDYTPLHHQDEYAAEVNVGWSVRERVWVRTVMVIGDETPKRRIGEDPTAGPAGLFEQAIAGESDELDSGDRAEIKDGWNIISSQSQVTDRWTGDPDEDQQIKVSVLTESVVERWNVAPERGTQSSPGGGSRGRGGPVTRTS